MEARRSITSVLTLGLLLIGCGDDPTVGLDAPETGPLQASTSAAASDSGGTSPSTAPPVTKPAKPEPSEATPRPPLPVLIATLRRAGAQSVGQAEPPHGSAYRIFSGRFDGSLFLATAGRTDLPSSSFDQLREVSSSQQNGITVWVMSNEDGRYTTLACRGVRWLFGSAGGTARRVTVALLLDVANAMADAC